MFSIIETMTVRYLYDGFLPVSQRQRLNLEKQSTRRTDKSKTTNHVIQKLEQYRDKDKGN